MSGLHEEGPIGMKSWWRPRLRTLCEQYGHQFFSENLAALQVNPWASSRFDSQVQLPSQRILLGIAEAAVERGATLILMRAANVWLKSDILNSYSHLYRTKSPRCSFVTRANLGEEAWAEISDRLKSIRALSTPDIQA
jgi:hypothetical protein